MLTPPVFEFSEGISGRPYPHHMGCGLDIVRTPGVRIRYCPHHSLSAKGTKEEVSGTSFLPTFNLLC